MKETIDVYHQEEIPGLGLREIVETLSLEDRKEYKQKLLDEISDRETLVWIINEVNEAEGLTDEY